ncbi:ATP-binding protein [Streptomyces venezuelae]|uniref:ATP-binding protein n=1 Tax=Streptomyces venezuelae TaxID=54571 RepID=A0A5P2CNP5_STRVZ|nr:ATP-binding protein [Streptomyces venezuelae]QES43930.1 ATP-binding protein [Streptomyces venezuelae]
MPELKAPPARDWVMGYPMALATVRLARRHVRRRLTTWAWTGNIDDAVLVVSELLANAVRHGKVPGHHVWLRLAMEEGVRLVVDVSDPVPVFPAFDGGVGAAVDGGEGGRGLLVVRQLTVEFDWFPRTGVGKTVRARVGVGAR